MSVESIYFIVDWALLQRLPQDTDLVEHFTLGPETDDDDDDDDDDEWQAEGSRSLDFGDYDFYFKGWKFFTEVSDWLPPLRGKLDKSIERPFTTLFTAIGILFDDSNASAAIKQGIEFTDPWLIATISPAGVEQLRTTARALDRSALEREFGRVLAERPCPGLPNGKAVVEWVDALDAALSSVGKDEGLLILCPA